MTRMGRRSQADESLIIPVLIQAIMVHSTQVDLVDFCCRQLGPIALLHPGRFDNVSRRKRERRRCRQ